MWHLAGVSSRHLSLMQGRIATDERECHAALWACLLLPRIREVIPFITDEVLELEFE